MVGEAQNPPCVLITRPESDAQRIKPDLEKLGFKVIMAPLMEVHYLTLPKSLPDYEAVILTSQKVIPVLKKFNVQKPIFCVGHKTADLLIQSGFIVEKSYARAADLIQALKESRQSYLYLSGVHKTSDFSQLLPHCTLIEVYTVQEIDELPPGCLDALKKQSIQYILVYSHRSAQILGQHLVKYRVKLNKIKVIAISSWAAEPLQHLNFNAVEIAGAPNHNNMLERLEKSQKNKGIFYG